MRFLRKSESSTVLGHQLRYPQDARQIRDALASEQSRFCAYSEEWLKDLEGVDVEHFDGRLKHTPEDSYWNWYAVLHSVNQRKARKIENFEPLPQPFDSTLRERIVYEGGEFTPTDVADVPVSNLLRYLNINRYEVSERRRKHVDRIRFAQANLSSVAFEEYLRTHPENLSFPTALQAELGLDVDALILRSRASNTKPA